MTTLAINATGQFTLNGVPTFLLDLTYFDAINARQSDLADFQVRGFNALRLMLDWPNPTHAAGSLFNANGTLKTTEKATLLAFIQAADALGIVCELIILNGTTDAYITTGAERTSAIQNACGYFGNEPNVMFDVCNEIASQCAFATTFASHGALLNTAQAATAAICFVSGDRGTTEADGPAQNETTDVVDTSYMTSWMNNANDVYAPHYAGNAQWWWSKYRRVANTRDWLDANGHASKPIYINEDNRWGTGYGDAGAGDIAADSYISTILSAKRGGAAGCVFHSNASYNLAIASAFVNLFTNSPAVESDIYNRVGAAVAADGIVLAYTLLDDFNRADTGPPPGPQWVVASGTGLKVVSNVAARDAALQQACAWGAYYYKDQSASFTVASTPETSGSAQVICLRMVKPYDYGSDHYDVEFANNATPVGVVQIFLVNASGTFTQLGATITLGAPFATNDVLRATMIGNTITAYVNGTLVGTRTDGTLPLGGYTGIRVGQFSSATFDDYKAGAIYPLVCAGADDGDSFQIRQAP